MYESYALSLYERLHDSLRAPFFRGAIEGGILTPIYRQKYAYNMLEGC